MTFTCANEDNLPMEQQLEREKGRSKKANETIGTLLEQITQYKQVLENEKRVLEEQANQERSKNKQYKATVMKLEKQLDTLKGALGEAMQRYP